VGRINLTYALTDHGTTRTEYTIVRLAENDYYLVSAGAWTAYDADFLRKAPRTGWRGRPYDIHDVTTQWGVFALAGPNSARILRDIVKDADPDTVLSNKRFPWLSARNIELGMCPVARSAWPIPASWAGNCTTRSRCSATCGTCCWSAGEKHGLKLVGARAQNWLRQEKSYRAFGNELGRDATPLEAGLDRFVDLSKDFRGKAGDAGHRHPRKCVTLLIDGPSDTDPWGKEALLLNGEKVGRLTSGGYSVAFGKQIGMGYVRPDLAEVGTKLKVKILRQEWDAVVTEDSPFDPPTPASGSTADMGRA
jgi:dimethylglycine dehydrogenase